MRSKGMSGGGVGDKGSSEAHSRARVRACVERGMGGGSPSGRGVAPKAWRRVRWWGGLRECGCAGVYPACSRTPPRSRQAAIGRRAATSRNKPQSLPRTRPDSAGEGRTIDSDREAGGLFVWEFGGCPRRGGCRAGGEVW